MKYDPKSFENKWKEKWVSENLYAANFEDTKTPKFYSLYSYPYPSGAGLHVGHSEGMVANDIMARYWRMKGRNVVLPMGWDSFGLPAENYAIKTGVPPQKTTDDAVVTFKEQINNLGISIDWTTEVGAHWPEYYKWTQWIFIQLFNKGLAYKKKAPVNWCPKDQTVLANEQVINGHCERCDTLVVQKDMEQWFFKITDFADRLDKDLDKVDWPESTKATQRNWIGKSVGAEIIWKLENPESKQDLEVKTFTTRFDTIPGPTFLVVAAEYKDLEKLITSDRKDEVMKYVEEVKNKTDLERVSSKEKTGVFTGSKAINPFNGEAVPIYVTDYVLATYGTGAVMGMPGHDQRDWEFAKKFDLPIKYTLKPKEEGFEFPTDKAFEGEGYEIDSGEFDGLLWSEAREKIIDKLEKEGKAIRVTNYKIRDWLLSRQRYWGCPIPIVYDPEGKPHAVDESDLPVLLPTDVDFLPTGESPMTRSADFKKRAEEKYGKGWHYEYDTMDTFVDSSWYFFRHIDAQNKNAIFDADLANYWLPTDLYMIGAEHIVLHLLYARFFTKFFFDQGLIKFDEPFQVMRHMGTILGPDGRKMSKRWGNVINPNDEIATYSADTVRMYEMFMGPLAEAKPWNDRSENGVFRFLNRVWDLSDKVGESENKDQVRLANKLVKRISEDTEVLSFNTAIARYMEFVNAISEFEKIDKTVWEMFLKTLAPYAPFITEELWGKLGNAYSIHKQEWPNFDPELVKDDVITMAVQFNGKVRGTIQISPEAEENDAIALAKADEKINKYLTGEPKKVIYIKGKILNIIV